MNRRPRLALLGVSSLAFLIFVPLLWGQTSTRRAILIVRLAPDAQLEIQGKITSKTGEVRRFVSPPLEVEDDYSYVFRATWTRDGQEREAERKVYFRGGQTVEVDLRTPDQLPLETYLLRGRLAQGETELLERLKSSPKDDQVRFGLGALQFIRAIEHLGQSLYRYGLRSDRGRELGIPFLRLPIPVNPDPKPCTYPALRQVFIDLIADLRKAEATLADVRDKEVKLPMRPGLIRLDFAGDGKSQDRLQTILNQYLGGRRSLLGERERIVFDRGDVAWLRGYCHLLAAMAEVFLAHDHQELFDCAGFQLFAKAETPHKFLANRPQAAGSLLPQGAEGYLDDIIVPIHLLRFSVKEPQRMKAALSHLESCLALSEESWRFILAEKDDDHEWIPNPRQKGALGIRVNQAMVDSWLAFIAECEAILSGKRLLPFWRGGEERGINLRRVFTEPRTLDLILWVQGTAATPYLEKGPLTQPAVWAGLQRVFGGDLLGFAVWFN